MKLIIYFCILAGLLCLASCNKEATNYTRGSYIATIYAIVILYLINTVAKYI